MASNSSGIVAGLTTAALMTVGFLAYQASASVPSELRQPHEDSTPAGAAYKAPRNKKNPTALPDGSGRGERVVYSVDDDRVWLVGKSGKVRRTFEVSPGTVDPAPGAYTVTSRSGRVTGTDGVPVEHVVRFTSVGGVSVGFSAAVDDTPPKQNAPKLTGGIRESRADGDALWDFATIGHKVVVIR
ncbi:secreted protein [Streptomyces davaonensis JCM 4913]|uniref:Secreted protein n=1 Tax=Streptomyces davaonensis (strain DSM 101723 / JCM 4913 / KCC S-0913 / 768) TaxID=1214101 RepID=K4R4K1_STRDJ|nr:L,D-transpeptidase [Streptomyces davaonensis]CCK28052.1 secreted protein [Streptomyces davaonensis JCM 4913]